MHRLHEDKKRFVMAALIILVACAVPHLHTTAFTLAFLLLAAMFYPSCRVLAEWQDEDTRKRLRENPKQCPNITTDIITHETATNKWIVARLVESTYSQTKSNGEMMERQE